MRTLYFLSILFLTSTGAIFAQDFDQRLLAGFTAEEVQKMVNEDPNELAFWQFFIEKGFVLESAPEEKGADMAKFQTLEIQNIEDWNVLAHYERGNAGRQYFSVENGSKLLVIRSIEETKKLMENEK
ncbi:MAG: hypothetical protein ACI9FU_000827 [Granulosicoccus sp.]|jgi:hypothetical protein